MTMADIERRLREVERQLDDINRQLTVLATGVALARWVGPFMVSIAAIVIVLLKG
jgi:hypothetical protein